MEARQQAGQEHPVYAVTADLVNTQVAALRDKGVLARRRSAWRLRRRQVAVSSSEAAVRADSSQHEPDADG